MTTRQQRWTGLAAALCLLFLIFDAKTVLSGAREGIEMILYTVIPTLFPFIVTTSILNNVLIGKHIPGLRKIGVLCGIPEGAESIFLLGMLGGYPVGAKMIGDAYEIGQLDRSAAKRLLGFCNNAGPAFIFGMISQMFTRPLISFIIWAIHVLSALLVGLILPGKTHAVCNISKTAKSSLLQMIEKSIKTLSVICAWIIIWKIAISICEQFFLTKLPVYLQVIFAGLCELTNGCIALNAIENEAVRFILASCMLSWGGMCIAMQTKSVVGTLGTEMYLLGKVMQILISFLLSAIFSFVLFPSSNLRVLIILIPVISVLICSYILYAKKKCKNNGSISIDCVV